MIHLTDSVCGLFLGSARVLGQKTMKTACNRRVSLSRVTEGNRVIQCPECRAAVRKGIATTRQLAADYPGILADLNRDGYTPILIGFEE